MKANEVIEMFSTEYDICGGTSKNAGKFYWQIAKEREDSIESKKGSKNDRFALQLGRRPLLSGIAKRPYIRRQTTHRKCECLCPVYSSKFGDFDRKGTPLFSVK